MGCLLTFPVCWGLSLVQLVSRHRWAGESGLWLAEGHDGVVWVHETWQNSLSCGPLETLVCHSCTPRAREVK